MVHQVWGLDLSNGLFLAMSRLVGWKLDICRVDTKRFVGLWEQATGLPIFILELIIGINEFGDPDQNHKATVCDITSNTFQLIGCGGFLFAALYDEIQPEISLMGL